MKYQSPFEPWAHQRTALKLSEGREFFAYQMAMRTGKTKVALDDFGRLEAEGKVNDLLVIAPAGVYKTWETAAKEHLAPALYKRLRINIWESGKNAHRAKIRAQFLAEHKRPRMLIMNIEALSSVDEAFKTAKTFLEQRSVYFAMDESTTIKNDSIRTKKALKLAPLATVRRILTGLISPRSPLDVFYQFQFLKPGCLGHQTFTTFKARYAVEEKICTLPTGILQSKLLRATGDGRVTIDGWICSVADLDRKTVLLELDKRRIWYDNFPAITGYKNEEELRDKIAAHSFRVSLADCYDLPPKLYSFRDVEMTTDQKRIYKSLKENATAELMEEQKTTGHVTALNVISRMIRLHQVLCGHTRDENNELHEVDEKRTKQLMEVLDEVEGKAIIWCSYDYNVRKISNAISKAYGQDSVARFWGGNIKTREAEEEQFRNNPECRFMVGTPSAGGRGRLWVVADTVIYFSNTNNLEYRSQSEERAQGIDKIKSVAYIDLIVRGTVDEKIIEALRNKIDMAATISGDEWRQWLI